MRWDAQTLAVAPPEADVLPGLGVAGLEAPGPRSAIAGLVRTVTTPEFVGMRFHEVLAKSVLNAVPAGSSMPFRFTVNPYRGCSHACVYCFARGTHSWLELDTGAGFDSEVVVKVNAAEVLRREVTKRSWEREHVALGTNTDPYQRAEGRYRLMPGIIAALADSGTPLSILTKGTLLRRDLPLLRSVSSHVPVGVGVSLAIHDDALHAALEPGAPSPRARLELVRAVRGAGLRCGVFLAPVLPWLTDGVDQLDHAIGLLAEAGASGVTVLALHLRPGAREWFMAWLGREHPELVERYEQLYGRGAYVPAHYRRWLAERVGPLLERHGLRRQPGGVPRGVPGDDEGSFPTGSLPTGSAPAEGRGRPAPPQTATQEALL